MSTAATTPKARKARQKKSWSRVAVALGGQTFTFWPTPDGLHRRLKGSPNVRTEPWAGVHAFLNDHRLRFDHDGRHYAMTALPDGLRITRNDTETKHIAWPAFIEWLDGQKLLPL